MIVFEHYTHHYNALKHIPNAIPLNFGAKIDVSLQTLAGFGQVGEENVHLVTHIQGSWDHLTWTHVYPCLERITLAGACSSILSALETENFVPTFEIYIEITSKNLLCLLNSLVVKPKWHKFVTIQLVDLYLSPPAHPNLV